MLSHNDEKRGYQNGRRPRRKRTGSPRSRHLTCQRFVGAKSHFASLGYEKTGTFVKDMLTIFFGAYLNTVPATMCENLISGDELARRQASTNPKLAARLRETFEANAGIGFVRSLFPGGSPSKNGKIVVAPESGRVVKKIYQLTAESWPSLRIARKLSAENAPTWRPQAKQTMYAKHFTALPSANHSTPPSRSRS